MTAVIVDLVPLQPHAYIKDAEAFQGSRAHGISFTFMLGEGQDLQKSDFASIACLRDSVSYYWGWGRM
jgi:hypothetical protein